MKVQIHGSQTHRVDVTVDVYDAAKVAADALLQMYGVDGYWVDKEGNLCEEIDYGHGTPGTEIRGKATEGQQKAYRLANDFLTMIREFKG